MKYKTELIVGVVGLAMLVAGQVWLHSILNRIC